MRKTIALLTMTSVINLSVYAPMAHADVITTKKEMSVKAVGLENVTKRINQFKSSVYARGADFQTSLEVLSGGLLNDKVSIADLQLYVLKNGTDAEIAKFNRVIELTLADVESLKEISAKELSLILSQAIKSGTESGAHFMSCSVGLGVGIPLLAAGLVVGIIALVHATANSEIVVKDYIEKREDLNYEYLNTKADLEFEMTTFESDIVYYGDEINEYQRMIDSGMYSTVDVEFFRQEIREFEFLISDANALIGEVQVDMDYFDSQFDADLTQFNQEEEAEISLIGKRKRNAGTLAIASGVSAALGSAFIFTGAYDCN